VCGRFTLTKRDFGELAALLEAEGLPEYAALYRPRYNIAPTDQHWLVREKQERRELLPAGWGLVNSWAKDAKGAARQINCRADTALKRPAFREAFARRRCIIPADGFFEWTGTKAARRPIWYHPRDDGLFLFAGVYESWHDPADGERRRTFSILTTDANGVVAPVHDRMPVILPPERVDDWLHVPAQDPMSYAQRLVSLMLPAPDGALIATEVSPRVNSVANDDPECLTPAGTAPESSPRLL
jgi:putative SOS response-associated peptidase YedK